jgi:FixJ family two-component response regulator
VVIIDDDPRVRESLLSLLNSAGITVRAYGSAADAFDSHALAGANCLITDICMPEMDGWEVQRRAAAEHPCLPLIFVTAHRDEAADHRALSNGAFAFIYKPFDAEELVVTIEAAVRPHRTGSTADSATSH